MTDKKAHDSVYGKLNNIYLEMRTPMIFVSTWVGFSVGILGEFFADSNSQTTSFVNIIGYSFIGVASGALWPIAMPLLSIGAIYNTSKKE